MKIYDIFHLAGLNLYRRLARSLLTLIGVVIGTASIILMVSIGLTNIMQFDEALGKTDLTKIQVSPPINNSSIVGKQNKLNDTVVLGFMDIKNVSKIVPLKNIQTYGKIENYNADYLNIMAIPSEEMINFIELEKGDYPNKDSSTPQIIMGMGIASQFVEKEEDFLDVNYKGPVLDWLKSSIDIYLGSRDMEDNKDIPSSFRYKAEVVGIIENRDEDFPNYDIYIDLEHANNMLRENHKLVRELGYELDSYDILYVYADKIENVKDILKKIKEYGFEAHSDTEWIEEMQRQERAQQGQLAAIGFISLFVSAIGIANTMMTGVLERRKEIGVMKVIGLSINKIRAIFLLEAAMIGFLGGIAGVILSHLFTYFLGRGIEETVFLGMYFSAGMKIIIPLWLDFLAVGLSIFVGAIAGVFPAVKATKTSPLEAIRG